MNHTREYTGLEREKERKEEKKKRQQEGDMNLKRVERFIDSWISQAGRKQPRILRKRVEA